MFGKKKAKIVKTSRGYKFDGTFFDVVRMTALLINCMEKHGFDMEEVKNALYFLEKPEDWTAEAYQMLQLDMRKALRTEPKRVEVKK